MGKLFHKSLFGGFRKKDVIAYIESSAVKQKESLQEYELRLQELQSEERDLQQQLQAGELLVEALKKQLEQAQEHTAALRREADSAENRGAEARMRVRALEEELAAVKAEGEILRADVAKQQESEEALETMTVRCRGLETRCVGLQDELDARQRQLDEQRDALAFQQTECDRLQKNYAALLQQRNECPVSTPKQEYCAVPQVEQEDLLYLHREIRRMRDNYDALVLSVLGNGRQPEMEAACRQDLLVTLNHQMDRALGYLEKLVDRQNCEQAQPVKAEPTVQAEPSHKESGKQPVTLEEILRLVRGNR